MEAGHGSPGSSMGNPAHEFSSLDTMTSTPWQQRKKAYLRYPMAISGGGGREKAGSLGFGSSESDVHILTLDGGGACHGTFFCSESFGKCQVLFCNPIQRN